MPAVSVIVPAWGVAHLVGEALASLDAQALPDWEAIVVDDGDRAVGEAVAPLATRDPRIRLLETGHGGLSAARNAALAAARGTFVALLDGDDAALPDYLATLTAALARDRGATFACCDAIYFGGTARDGELFSSRLPQAGEPTLNAVIARRFNIFVGVVVRRDALVAAGGFDESLPAAEDLDLWLRLLGAGARAVHVPTPLVRYRRRPGSLSSSPARLSRATATVYEKALARLVGRPEAVTARAMLAEMRDETGWAEGEDMVLAGDTRAGMRLLRDARVGRRGARWRLAMLLFRVVPAAARPLIARRRRAASR